MAKKDAEITVGADASAVERVAGAAKAAWKDAGQSLTASIGQAAKSVISSLADVALASGKINFSAQHEQVKAFESSSARLAVAMGSDFEKIRSQVESTGVAIGKRPQEVAAWISAVGNLTHNFQGAGEAIRGMSELAAETGRNVEDYQGLAVVLANVGHVAGDTSGAIGLMQSQVSALKNDGGIAAFAKQIEGLAGTLSTFSQKADFGKITGLAAELGKGVSKETAGRIQQTALGSVSSDPLKWERYLKRSITDEHGQVEKPDEVLRDIVEKTKKRYGKDARRVLMLPGNFGAEAGAALFNADFNAAARSSTMAPGQEAAAAKARLIASDAGKREVADAELAKSSRDLMGSSTALGRASDAIQKFAANNPITSTVLSTAATTGIGLFLAKYGGSIATLMGGKGAGGAAGGVIDIATKGTAAGSLVAKAGLVAGAGALGYMAGTALDEHFGLSDFYSGEPLGDEQVRLDAIKGERGQNAALRSRIANVKAISKGVRSAGLQGKDIGLALEAAQAVGAQAPESLQTAQGQAALAADLAKRGSSKEDAERIARAIVEAMKTVKFNVVTRSDTPVEVAAEGAKKAPAGNQGH